MMSCRLPRLLAPARCMHYRLDPTSIEAFRPSFVKINSPGVVLLDPFITADLVCELIDESLLLYEHAYCPTSSI